MSDQNKIDFIGIGAPRCGSTWVGAQLSAHPDILFSEKKSHKEVDYFNSTNCFGRKKTTDHYVDKNINWYYKHFLAGVDGKVRGEFSVNYLTDEFAYKRIAKDFPNIKILVVLRNPASMLYSLFWFTKTRIFPNAPSLDKFEDIVNSKTWLNVAMYAKNLRNFYNYFPASQIHVIKFDDIKTNPKAVLESMYQFLGVDKNFVNPEMDKKENISYYPRSMKLRNFSQSFLTWLDIVGLDWVGEWLWHNKAVRKFYLALNLKPHKYPDLPLSAKENVLRLYQEEVKDLERLTGKSFEEWYISK